MAMIRGVVADRLLSGFKAPAAATTGEAGVWDRDSLESLLGSGIWQRVRDRVVVDFGCGSGGDTVALAKAGARLAVGLDIRETVLEQGRRLAAAQGVPASCRFVTAWDEPADLVISIDAFEHFDDPADILRMMARMVSKDGAVLVSFGPTWFHPYGGHLFSVFPWAHLLFDEPSLLRWRARFRDDGATCFSEVEGGLNQMTVSRFERLVAASPLQLVHLDAMPIRRAGLFHGKATREFTTAIVRAELALRSAAG